MSSNQLPREYYRVIPESWTNDVASWLKRLSLRGLSAETIKLRRSQIARLAEDYVDGPSSVTAETLASWLTNRKWAPETLRSHVAAFRSFFGWWVSREEGRLDPTVEVPSVKRVWHRARPASPEVIHPAIEQASPRTRLMLRLAVNEGLRRGEVAQVHPRDVLVMHDGYWLVVHGKGAKDRVIPLWRDLALEILSHGDDFVFPGQDEGHLSPAYVGKLISRALPDRVSAHPLRHRFATDLFSSVRDITVVQRFLGHSKVETTQTYVEGSDEQLRSGLATLGDAPPF